MGHLRAVGEVAARCSSHHTTWLSLAGGGREAAMWPDGPAANQPPADPWRRQQTL